MTTSEGSESASTVGFALGVNLVVAGAKALAGVFTGSPAMFAEAAHSAVDSTTEVILLAGLRHARRPADARHPFGYGKAGFFWALIASVFMFVSGALFAMYEGIHTLTGAGVGDSVTWLAWVALGFGAVMDGASGFRAAGQLYRDRGDRSWWQNVMLSNDTAVRSVLFEDAADLAGIVFAAVGLGLRMWTGSIVWDGVASLLIGGLLAGLAWHLGRTNMRLLIGQEADPAMVAAVRSRLLTVPEVDGVLEVQSMQTGAATALVCARVDFDDTLPAARLEVLCARLGRELRVEFPDLDGLFIEPAPTGPGAGS